MARPATPIGTIRIHKRGKRRLPFAQVKTPDGWTSAARHSWIKNHGEIPPGMRLDFLDGDSTNVDISNLRLIPIRDAVRVACERRPERFEIGAAKRTAKLAQYSRDRSQFHKKFKFLRNCWYPVIISQGLVILDPHPRRADVERAYGINASSLISPALGKRFVDGDLVGYRRVTSLKHFLEKMRKGETALVDESDD